MLKVLKLLDLIFHSPFLNYSKLKVFSLFSDYHILFISITISLNLLPLIINYFFIILLFIIFIF